MMWGFFADRRILLDLLNLEPGPIPDLFGRNLEKGIPPISEWEAEVLTLWREKPRSRMDLPAAIVTRSGEQESLLAWTWASLRTLRPLTSLVRVAEHPVAKAHLEKAYSPLPPWVETASMGLILSEAASYLPRPEDIIKLSSSSFSNTMSFSLARWLALGAGTSAEALFQAWKRVREICGTSVPIQVYADLLEAWKVIISLVLPTGTVATRPSSSELLRACEQLRDDGDISQDTWETLTRRFPSVRQAWGQMKGTREQRVVAFETATKALSEARADHHPENLVGSFLFGYLASRLASGELEHISLVSAQQATYPATLIWYGLCAGIMKGSQIRALSNGLTLRILRDLSQSDNFLSSPRCDIAMQEFEVASRRENSSPGFLTGSLGQLVVEISPCVTTAVKWPALGQEQLHFENQPRIDIERARDLMSRLGWIINDAAQLCEDVGKQLGSPASRQRNYRPPRSKKP